MGHSNRPVALSLSLTGALILLFLGLSLISPRSAKATTTVNREPTAPEYIVLVIVDALRADHVSAYGYERTTTPNLDRHFADEGIVFRHASSISPWTCPSNASVFTGRRPGLVGTNWETMGTSIPAAEKTLAEYLEEAGYYTAGFVSTFCTKAGLGFAQGFDHYDDSLSGRPTSDKARAEEINSLVLEWLENVWQPADDSRPLFLFIYYFDPHTWYDPPPPYATLYDTTYTGTLTSEVYADGKDVVSGDIVPSARDVQHLLALYDGEITYWDHHLGLLMDEFAKKGILDEALMIVTSDHGEMFGEHGEWAHGRSLYEEVLRVPLMLRYPGVITAGLEITHGVQTFDLVPTILNYAGISPTTVLQGQNLVPFIERPWTMPLRPLYGEVGRLTDPNHPLYWTAPRVDLRAISKEGWKLIYPLGSTGDSELYALQDESLYEFENVAAEERERADALRQEMIEWFYPNPVYLPTNWNRN